MPDNGEETNSTSAQHSGLFKSVVVTSTNKSYPLDPSKEIIVGTSGHSFIPFSKWTLSEHS